MRDLKDKTAFITGAASGIGLATARALAAKGARLILADMNEARLAEAVSELKAAGTETLGIAMGLRNELADSNVGISVLLPGMVATNIVETTRTLRPGVVEDGAAAQTAQNMDGVLAAGMNPAAIGPRVVQAIEANEFYIFTHPEWKRLAEPQIAEMLAAFGPSADPNYGGDNIDSLLAANGAKRMNVSVAG